MDYFVRQDVSSRFRARVKIRRGFIKENKMALILHNPGPAPLGQFDCLDTQLSGFLGGEVVTWGSVSTTSSDLATADIHNDGYIPGASPTRVVVQRASSATTLPIFLADDGVLHYGTILGVVVGGTAGQQVTGGTVLGPSSAYGSGKLTCWDKAGLFGVTLDAVDTTSATGLVPNNTSLAVGTELCFTATGLLTPHGSAQSASGALTVGRFASFETNGSLVNTPQSLIAALNSPSGNVSSLTQLSFYQAVFYFYGASGSLFV